MLNLLRITFCLSKIDFNFWIILNVNNKQIWLKINVVYFVYKRCINLNKMSVWTYFEIIFETTQTIIIAQKL